MPVLLSRSVGSQTARSVCLSLSTALLVLLSIYAGRAQASRGEGCERQNAPVLQTRGAELLIDGVPSFAVLVSYFDAMRASAAALETDFAFLASKGVRGVRIFPLWIRDDQRADATLVDANGRVRSPERWTHFTGILEKAAACGLIVDVTFNREQLAKTSTFTVAEFESGIAEIARRLKAAGSHSHVLFDLQNERNHPDAPAMQLTVAEVRRLRDAVKRADPGRLLSMSTQGGVAESLSLARLAKLDVIAYHEIQEAGWYKHTPAIVRTLRAGGLPIYLQEMARAPDRGVTCDRVDLEADPLVQALRAARLAGAAAWTFHTGAGFQLDVRPFQQELASCPREVDFLERLRTVIPKTP